MNDYIKRSDAVNAVYHHCPSLTMIDVQTILHEAQSADVQPVRHGRWIIKDNPGTGWYRITCSECGEDVTSTVPVIGFIPNAKATWDYCPECGARMDGEQNGSID